jgi:excinuclease ABC subunit A
LSERHFSPWSNIGQCPECKGIGLGCPVCNGFQLRDVALQSKWEIFSWLSLHSKTLLELNKELPDYLKRVPERLKNTVLDIPIRISILCDLGIGHLSLGRLAETLSSGEAQRVRLAALCTGHLNGVLLCIDEPASGLHEKDVEKLWNALLQLKQRGNTLAIIEHHPRMINRADYVIEMGPGAGEEGGEIVRIENGELRMENGGLRIENGEWRIENNSSNIDEQKIQKNNSQFSILNSQFSTCPFLTKEAWVWVDGTFQVCPNPDARFGMRTKFPFGDFGNFATQEPLEIWNGEKYREFCENYKENPICKNCKMRCIS